MSELVSDRRVHDMPAVVPSRVSSLPWLFSPAIDLATFLGSAAMALALLAVGGWCGWLNQDSPDWLWIAAVLMIDVAHVYATAFRVYFDRTELFRRPWLYGLVPLLAFVICAALYSEGPLLFWRTLAYLAVFHFVRQQYGWVALYRARAHDHALPGRVIDTAAIYLATLYPLVYWHCHPQRFSWFVAADFTSLPMQAERILAPLYWTTLGVYAARVAYQGACRGRWNPGKDVVVLTTAVCWYVGIVSFNSDYAFNVTNVIIHGVPYMVLVYWYRVHCPHAAPSAGTTDRCRWLPLMSFVGVLWMAAFFEELLWDCGLWHERSWLFGPAWNIGEFDQLLVPLLSVPQITHYVLDGFVWRRRSNPDFANQCGLEQQFNSPP